MENHCQGNSLSNHYHWSSTIMKNHKFCTALAALNSMIVITSSWAFALDCFFYILCLPPRTPYEKQMCSQNRELSVQIPLSILFLFYSMWAKLCQLYLSRALVKSFSSSYLECKNTNLSLRQRLRGMANTYKMLEKLELCACWKYWPFSLLPGTQWVRGDDTVLNLYAGR